MASAQSVAWRNRKSAGKFPKQALGGVGLIRPHPIAILVLESLSRYAGYRGRAERA
jgi:hypothetical protein